jgi:ribose 5-phosphate isomerase B
MTPVREIVPWLGPSPAPEPLARAAEPARLAVACDHTGYALKRELAGVASELGWEIRDFGTDGPAAVDYPDLAAKAAGAVASGQCRLGLLICGTGLGMAIAANKLRGIRAVTCNEPYLARMAREHNDANVVCLGARVLGTWVAAEILRVFLSTPFAGDRHARRVLKIQELESSSLPPGGETR